MRTLSKLLAVLLLLAMPLAAEELPVVTLAEALSAAEENNISLETARVSLEQVIRNQNNVMSTFMPTVTLGADIGPTWSFPTEKTSDFSYDGLDLSATATASFSFTGSMLRDSQTRTLLKEEAGLSYLSSYDSIVSSVTTAYWQLAVLESSVDLAQASLDDAYSSYLSVYDSYENGQTDELTMYQTELAWNEAEYTLQTAKDSLTTAMQAFRNMTGLEGDFRIGPVDDGFTLSLPTPEELFAEYAAGTVELRAARNTLAQADLAVTTAKLSAYVPTLTTSLKYTYTGGWDDKWDYGSNSHKLTGTVGVSVPVSSMLPGGSGSVAVKNAKDTLAIAALSLEDTEKDLLETIRSGVTAINQAQHNRTITERTRKNAKRSYELSQEAFEAGLMTADDLSSARTSYLSAESSCLSLAATHLTACYDLAITLNLPFEELKTKYSTETI